MNPYYQDKWVTIYHGDCREILPHLDAKIDLVLTDPPYPNQKGGLNFEAGDTTARSKTVGDIWHADLSWISEAWRITDKGMMVFCGTVGILQMAKVLPQAFCSTVVDSCLVFSVLLFHCGWVILSLKSLWGGGYV